MNTFQLTICPRCNQNIKTDNEPLVTCPKCDSQFENPDYINPSSIEVMDSIDKEEERIHLNEEIRIKEEHLYHGEAMLKNLQESFNYLLEEVEKLNKKSIFPSSSSTIELLEDQAKLLYEKINSTELDLGNIRAEIEDLELRRDQL